MNRTWIAALLLAACGPAATSPPETPSNHTAARPAPTPCPAEAELAETARRAWGKGPGTVTAGCVALIRKGATLWFVDGFFEPAESDGTIGMWSALVTPAGEVTWTEGADDLPESAMWRASTSDHVAADLDGDGDDEVLWIANYDHHGYISDALVAAAIVDGGLVVGEAIPLSSDNSAAIVDDTETPETCSASWELVPAGAGRRVAVDYGDDCATPGRKVFTWTGKGLVEVPR